MGFNNKRIAIGGLVAGIIVMIIGSALVPILGKEMGLALSRFNLPPLSPTAMVFFAFESLVLGITLVWLYAAMLPRLKQKTRAAVYSALIVWLLAYFFANFAMVAYGFMPIKLTAIGTIWGLLELLSASLIGTRFYKEA